MFSVRSTSTIVLSHGSLVTEFQSLFFPIRHSFIKANLMNPSFPHYGVDLKRDRRGKP